MKRPDGTLYRIPMKLQRGVFTVELRPVGAVKTAALNPVDEDAERGSALFQRPATKP